MPKKMTFAVQAAISGGRRSARANASATWWTTRKPAMMAIARPIPNRRPARAAAGEPRSLRTRLAQEPGDNDAIVRRDIAPPEEAISELEGTC